MTPSLSPPSAGAGDTSVSRVLRIAGSRLLQRLIVGYFLVQASYMALTTKIGIPPDERWHIGLIRFYVENGWSPFVADQRSDFQLGDLERNPNYLYHYGLSFLYRLSPFGDEGTVILLRFVNIALAALTIFVLLAILRRLRLPLIVQNLTVFLLINTLMFTFLSASVNYDNLLILLAAIAFYGFFGLLEEPNGRSFVTLLLGSLGAILAKQAAVPLVLLLFGVLALAHWRRWGPFLTSIRRWFRPARPSVVLACVCMLILIGLVAERYVGNVIQYGKLGVSCDRVHDVEQCEQYAVFSRNRTLAMNKPPSDQLMSLPEFSLRWTHGMFDRTVRIFAHKVPRPIYPLQMGAFIVAIVLIFALIREMDRQYRTLNYGVAVAGLYILVLLLVNWKSYRQYGVFGLALQGRYAFPVIGIVYMAGSFYLLRLLKGRRFGVLVGLTCLFILFAGASLPAYLYSTDSTWYRSPMASPTSTLHDALHTLVP